MATVPAKASVSPAPPPGSPPPTLAKIALDHGDNSLSRDQPNIRRSGTCIAALRGVETRASGALPAVNWVGSAEMVEEVTTCAFPRNVARDIVIDDIGCGARAWEPRRMDPVVDGEGADTAPLEFGRVPPLLRAVGAAAAGACGAADGAGAGACGGADGELGSPPPPAALVGFWINESVFRPDARWSSVAL